MNIAEWIKQGKPINSMIFGDCQEGMKEFPDNYVDLGLVDVSYGIGQGGGNNKTRNKLAIAKNYKDFGDSKPPNKNYFNELFRISKNQIIWGANHFISKIPYDSSCWLVWDKGNGKNHFADSELAWTNFNSAVRNFKYRWAGMLQENMKDKEKRSHPAQKPVALYCWILKNYAKPSDLILDTHFGSASSIIACIEMGHPYIAFEIDVDYYNDAVNRVNEFKKQGNFFIPEKKKIKQLNLI